MLISDLGQLGYREAWKAQEEAHAEVCGGEERVLFVEHPAVITLGRRAGIEKEPARNVLASAGRLGAMGIELIESDRGGDVTFHGPGQIVAYPIVRLGDHRLSVGAYVRRLEDVVIGSLAEFGIIGHKNEAAIGVWVGEGGEAEKICALGVRIRRGVSLHGIALNVETDLSYFDLIVPCGLNGRRATSMRKVLGSVRRGLRLFAKDWERNFYGCSRMDEETVF